jgi:putative transposase
MPKNSARKPPKTAPEIKLTKREREELESFANSRSLPHALVVRAKLVLLAAEGLDNLRIAERVGLSRISVGKWRKRYADEGLCGIYDQLRSGRPRQIEDERIAQLVNDTLQRQPKGATHWTVRSMGAEVGVSKSTVQRVWNTFGLQPHRQKHFKLSTDPFFVEKLRDIVGLYLNPPENAVVLCVDEKSQCQALERTQPVLPVGLGYVEGVTHDYIRHGTLTLFAALDVAEGKVLAQCKPKHRHQEFLSFLRHIDKSVPSELDLHVILDNYASHSHPKVKAWLAARPRFHFHFTPTYSSWLNQVERWFGIITQQAIRRGSFRSTKELAEKIDAYVQGFNRSKARPFKWTATADSILAKIERLCKRISGTPH